MKLFEKEYNYLYKTIHDDEAPKRMSLDRNGIRPESGRATSAPAGRSTRATLWQPEGAIDVSGGRQAFAMIVLGITVAHARALSKAR